LQVRYFPKEAVETPVASFLDIILYSREQIRKENAAMGNEGVDGGTDAPWGVVSIKPQVSLLVMGRGWQSVSFDLF
jgi:hypothetical protein